MNDNIAADVIRQFQSDGAVVIRQLINDEWIERLRGAIERDIENPGPCFHGYAMDGGGRFHGNMLLWKTDRDFCDYCQNSPLPEVAAQFLQVDQVQLYYDQLFVKEAATDAPTRWHNDQPYWPIRGKPLMSFWLALDPVRKENGALEFVKGSHRWEAWYQPEPFAAGASPYERNPDFVDMPDISSNRDQYEFLSWEMEPGDVIAFHALTVHGGPPNLSDRRRRGYTVRYCGPGMTYYKGPGTSPFLDDASLEHGASIQGDRYPVVWSAS